MVVLALLALSYLGLAQKEPATNKVNVWLGGEATISSLPNIGLAPVIKAEWHDYILSYSVAMMTAEESWLNFELGILGKTFSYQILQKNLTSQIYVELYGAVMAQDIQNQSFLSLNGGIIGGIKTPLTEKISCDFRVGLGLGTNLKARLWSKVGINVLFWSF